MASTVAVAEGGEASAAAVPLWPVRVEGKGERQGEITADTDGGTLDDGGVVLTRAYILGMAVAVLSSIPRVTCDSVVSPTAVRDRPLAVNGSNYYTGDWEGAEGEHASGELLARAAALAAYLRYLKPAAAVWARIAGGAGPLLAHTHCHDSGVRCQPGRCCRTRTHSP